MSISKRRTPRRPGTGQDIDRLRRRNKRHIDRRKAANKRACRCRIDPDA